MSTGEIILALAAIVAGALVKAVTGVGFPLLAVPVIAAFTSIEAAVVVIALPNLVANLVLTFRERDHHGANPDLPVLVVTSLAGGVSGTFLLTRVPSAPLTLALAAMVIVYVVTIFVTPDFTLPRRAARRGSPVVGAVAGVAQGATGVSGPLVVTWTTVYRLPRDAFVASVTAMFAASGLGQIIGIVADGSYDRGRITATLAGIVVVLVTLPLGARLRRRIPLEAFQVLVMAVLVVSAVTLVIQVAT
ncbi:MAG: sulfite exporter TauE/SafE family protein [Acidimicrobiales bacterium]